MLTKCTHHFIRKKIDKDRKDLYRERREFEKEKTEYYAKLEKEKKKDSKKTKRKGKNTKICLIFYKTVLFVIANFHIWFESFDIFIESLSNLRNFCHFNNITIVAPEDVLSISEPTNFVRILHVDSNFNWNCKDPSELFEIISELGTG